MPGSNESLATATVVPDPTKSWAIYGQLHEGAEAQYYRFDAVEGQRIHVSLLKSTAPDDEGFLPSFVLMGPKITLRGNVPAYVEVPQGAGSMVVEGKQPTQASYEAFSPSAFYLLAELEVSAPSSGSYYVAVYEASRGGHYGLAIGDRESFTLSEWILSPVSFISIYQWEGQSLPFMFAPAAATLAVGIGLVIFRRRVRESPKTVFEWSAALAGLLFLASGFTVLTQMISALTRAPAGPDIGITLTLALVPVILGVVTVRLALRTVGRINVRKRMRLAILGLLALFAWAGFIVGPSLAILASVLPYPRSLAAKPKR